MCMLLDVYVYVCMRVSSPLVLMLMFHALGIGQEALFRGLQDELLGLVERGDRMDHFYSLYMLVVLEEFIKKYGTAWANFYI